MRLRDMLAAQRRGVDAFMAEFGDWLRSKKQAEAA